MPDSKAIGTCHCCRYDNVEIKPFERAQLSGGGVVALCYICRSTLLSNIVMYPGQSPDAGLYQGVGWVGNFLADLIAGKVGRNGEKKT